eukprot:scaffold99182_cov24-Tisochrysis_lutea.AAC.1
MRGHGRARAIACMCYKQGGVTCRPWGLRELGNEKNLACLYELALCVRCAGHSHQSMLLRTGAAPDEEELHADFGDSVRLKPHVLPGATGEIARILSARDFFAVMDVPRDSDAERIKKAFRSKLFLPSMESSALGNDAAHKQATKHACMQACVMSLRAPTRLVMLLCLSSVTLVLHSMRWSWSDDGSSKGGSPQSFNTFLPLLRSPDRRKTARAAELLPR